MRLSARALALLCVALLISVFFGTASASAAVRDTASGAPHVLNLHDFGNAGAGDPAADARAFDAALATLKGRARNITLFLPAGRYVLPALDLPDNVQILGDGATLAGANGRLTLRGGHRGLNFQNIGFEGLALDGVLSDLSFVRCRFAATDVAPAFATAATAQIGHSSIVGATFTGTSHPAIALEGHVQYLTIISATITGRGNGAEFNLGDSGSGVTVASVDFQNIGRTAIRVVSGTGIVFRNISATNTGQLPGEAAPIFQVDRGGHDIVFQAVHTTSDTRGAPSVDFRLDGDGTTLDGVIANGNPRTGRSIDSTDPNLFINDVRAANRPASFRSIRALEAPNVAPGTYLIVHGTGDGSPDASQTAPSVLDLTAGHSNFNPATDIPVGSGTADKLTCGGRNCSIAGLRLTPRDWAKMGVVNVAAFGALPSDPTAADFDPTATPPDMSTTLQKAIDAAGAESGSSIVYLPPGVYGIGTPLLLKEGVTLVGAGRTQTILKARERTLPTFFSLNRERGAAHIGLFDLALSGGTNGLTAAPDAPVTDLFVARTTFTEQSDTALALPHIRNSLIADSSLNAARYGLRATGAADPTTRFDPDHPSDAGIIHSLTVLRSTFSDMTGDGVSAVGPLAGDSALFNVTGTRLGGALVNVAGDGWYIEHSTLRGAGMLSKKALSLAGMYNVLLSVRGSNGDSPDHPASVVLSGGSLRYVHLQNGSRNVPALVLSSPPYGAVVLDHVALDYSVQEATAFFRAGGAHYIVDIRLGSEANVVAVDGDIVRQVVNGFLKRNPQALVIRSAVGRYNDLDNVQVIDLSDGSTQRGQQ